MFVSITLTTIYFLSLSNRIVNYHSALRVIPFNKKQMNQMMKIRDYFTIIIYYLLFGLFCSFTEIVNIDHLFSSMIKMCYLYQQCLLRHFKHSDMHRYEDRERK